MADVESQIHLARKLQTVEHDRIELMQQAVEVLRSIQSGNHAELTMSLAGVVGLAYLLGVQMGISPRQIDSEIIQEFSLSAEVDSVREADLARVVQYLSNR